MRWIFRLLGIVILLAAFAVGAVFFLPKDRIAAIASDQLRAQTGRELTVSDEIALSFWPVLGVTTGPVTLSDADWAGPDPMMAAQGLSIGVDARALIGGEIKIKHIEAQSPVVRLTTRADGRGNWEFGEAPAADTQAGSGATASTQSFGLERLTLSDAQLIYTAAGAEPLVLSDLNATLDWPDPNGAADIAMSFTQGIAEMSFEGRIGGFGAFLEGAVAPVSLTGTVAGAALSFEGRASTGGDAAGRVEMSARDTGAVLAALGSPGAAPPAGFGQSAEAAMDLTFTEGNRITMRDLTLKLDQNLFTGAADILLSDVPQVTANLVAGDLDFSAVTNDGSGTASAAPAGSGWSKDPIDASGLAAMNGTIALAANSIDLGNIQLGASRLSLNIDRSRAVLQLGQVAVFDGSVTGQLVANNRNGLSVGGDLTASQIELERMLSDLAGITRLSGRADARVQFLGVGQTMDSIMKSLSGQGSLSTGRGLIAGIDLDRLMRSGDGTGGTTVFDSLSATYTMDKGNLFNSDLLLLLANFRAEGEGRIGIGAQDIDYLFTPIALRANSGQGLAIPVRIRGPWSNPRIIPDLSEALQLDVDGKVEEVKKDARESVERKLQEELGVIKEEGQSTEDAIKDALGERAKERLKKLLGGD
ncbi:AsmA family protein [Aestuariivita boseongensis]|uniref:AsmA family protein n=1 Tax=Aestuariivita boseongensis TaxID=1470562 RepID=UPI0006801E36|nr:AsmA family protein [Aestuariivita boseongensis]